MDLILPSSPPHQPQISDDLLVGANIRLRVSKDQSDKEESDDPTSVTATTPSKPTLSILT